MLQTKELCKCYKPRKGVPVQAVDHVSIRFPEKGMVFLLGKSGSGKSTMLNLLGGLDNYDGGEIIIKGISSKDFNQQRFDSYRNTYVGFIFQEYNVLEEFSVGANIALAIELQGKKAEDEMINRILKEVDLDGFGDRKPNELSGGQKQRVAIARALVKNPEIIMADEPTGALDSNTGRQILDTLKKLSKEKLVIIVSHDREYAEQYADRIIEMADGKVVRDVQASGENRPKDEGIVFRTNTVEIPGGYHLTEEDRLKINEYIDKVKHGLTLTVTSDDHKFKKTDESSIPEYSGDDFKLIRSKLPMKSAVKIGSSSLKYKKFRLIMTVLLSVVAFSMFTMVDTFSSYNHIRSCVDSLVDSDINYISLGKQQKITAGTRSRWSSVDTGLTKEDLETIENDTGIPVIGIYSPVSVSLDFSDNLDLSGLDNGGYEATTIKEFGGFAEISEESLEKTGCKMYAGKIPDKSKDEIAISLFAAETFKKYGYVKAEISEKGDSLMSETGMIMNSDILKNTDLLMDSDILSGSDDFGKKERVVQKITEAHYMIGKTLLINNKLYTISGIVDTNFDSDRFSRLNNTDDSSTNSDLLVNFLLYNEYEYALDYSLTGAAMIGEGKMDSILEEQPLMFSPSRGTVWFHGDYDSTYDQMPYYSPYYFTELDKVTDDQIIWTDGPVSELKDNEIIITLSSLEFEKAASSTSFVSMNETVTEKELDDAVSLIRKNGGLFGSLYSMDSFKPEELKDIKVVGCFKSDSSFAKSGTTVLSDELLEKLVGTTDGIYKSAVGEMPDKKSDIEKVVRYCYRDKGYTERYSLNNAVTYELDTFNGIINVVSNVFFYIGVFFAVFASLLMANFISVSISYKKQEIGILRAIGSRSNDVFRIFFSESFIIAIIEFILSTVMCLVGVLTINSFIRGKFGILVTLLHFGPRQIILTLLISVGIAAVASFIPVMKIASKKPIDAIRNK